jgi:hypothetical protein
LQVPPKFTQIGIFGLKTNHLATLFHGLTDCVEKTLAKSPLTLTAVNHVPSELKLGLKIKVSWLPRVGSTGNSLMSIA